MRLSSSHRGNASNKEFKKIKKCVSHLRALCISYMQAETQPAQHKKIKAQDIDIEGGNNYEVCM